MSSNQFGGIVYSGGLARRIHSSVLVRYFSLILILGFVSGCGGGSGTVTVSSVAITPTAATVSPGAQSDFTATVNLSNTTTTSSTSTTVTWEVNGVTGGNSSIGTIVSSSTDNQLGVYTAPAVVPTTNNGVVNITAVAQQTDTTASSSTSTVTSNVATVTVGVTQGFSMSPTVATLPAGGTEQFTAILNGVTDVHATWTVTSSAGGNPGTIGGTSGLYVAPLIPPLGNSITVTSTDGTNTASEIITLTYSDHSLTGPYAFSYTGDNQLGFYAVAGSFVTDGNGNIESGVEDIDSFQTGVTQQIPITGNYVVTPDGRGTVNLNTGNTWRFVLATNQHALILRSDVSNTGSGTMDQQNVNALTSSKSVVSGVYAFGGLGADATFKPVALGGRFVSDGAGNIPAGANIVDLNDNGTVIKADSTLSGTYTFDANFAGTGRGIFTFNSTATGPRTFAFYAVTSGQLHVIETDHNGYFAGDAYGAATGPFAASNLGSGSYVFSAGGNSTSGAYAAAGLFASDGAGNMTGGAFDTNNAGTLQTNVTLTSCGYTVDATTGRVDLKLCGAGSSEFAVYPTSQSTDVMVEIDSAATSAGVAYVQTPSAVAPSGNFAMALTGEGIFHSALGSYQQDADGQLVLSSGGFTGGNLDINNFNGVFSGDTVNLGSTTSGTTTTPLSVLNAPGTNGRGTGTITGTNPAVTYKLVYYVVNQSTAVLLDQDSGFILSGVLEAQF